MRVSVNEEFHKFNMVRDSIALEFKCVGVSGSIDIDSRSSELKRTIVSVDSLEYR